MESNGNKQTNNGDNIIISSTETMNQIEKASIDQQIATAKKYQRNTKLCIEEAQVIVTTSKEIARSCGYTLNFLKDKKTKKVNVIKGKSVHLARILAQCFGNMRLEQGILYADATHVTSYGICFDLEKNIAQRVLTKKPIIKRDGTRYSEDMIARTGMAAAAIAKRNAIFAVIPAAISELVYNKAQDFLKDEMSDQTKFLHERKRVFKQLENIYDINEEEALRAVGLKKIEQLTTENLLDLIDILNALESKDLDPETVKGETPLSGETVQSLKEDVKVMEEEEKKNKKKDPEFLNDSEDKKIPKKKPETEHSDKKVSPEKKDDSPSHSNSGEIEFNK